MRTALLCLLLIGCTSKDAAPKPADDTPEWLKHAKSRSHALPSVSADAYQHIQTGMTYEEVRGVVGFEGEEKARTELGGATSVMVQWINADGSGLICQFQDGRLVTKAQTGLK